MVRLATVVEPVLAEGLVVVQFDLPSVVGGAVDHSDELRVLAISIDREVEGYARSVHAGLGEVKATLPGVEHEPLLGEARDHADSLAVRVVLGAGGEGKDGEDEGQDETNTVHRKAPVGLLRYL